MTKKTKIVQNMMRILLLVACMLAAAGNAKAQSEIQITDRYDWKIDGLYLKAIAGSNYTEVEVVARGTAYDPNTSHTYAYSDYEGDVKVPEYVMNGAMKMRIAGIGASAFADCKNLTSVSLAEGIDYIGYGAFKGCI
jgi:hypothetical protein